MFNYVFSILILFLSFICQEISCFEDDKFIDVQTISNKFLDDSCLSLKNKKLPNWMLSQIQKDFQKFKPFSVKDLELHFDNSERGLIYIRIRNNKVFFQYNTKNPQHSTGTYTRAIQKLITQPETRIENGDFLVNLFDTVHSLINKYPILSITKNFLSNDVLIPDRFAISKRKNRLMNDIDKSCLEFPWEIKINKAFWIGAANGKKLSKECWRDNNRARLVLFSIDHPDIIWAKFINIKISKKVFSEMKDLDYLLSSDRISPFDSCQYKYLLDVDGWSVGFERCRWILRSNCVLIKQQSKHFQWYYSGLKPYVHYVPYKGDCSDLLEIITWLRKNEDEAKTIALNGRDFSKTYLDADTTFLYLYEVLKEYNKLNETIENLNY